MSSSEVCKQLLLSDRQCLVMVHRGQGCVVIKVAGIIQGLHYWPASTYCCAHKLEYACDVLNRHASHNARQDGQAFQIAGCGIKTRVSHCQLVTYLMGAEALLAKHASQSSVLNQGCVVMSATPPLRFPILLLKSACTCAEPVESPLSCHHDRKRHHAK